MSSKIALVSGGNRGIGLETCKQLAELGITVYMGCRDLAQGLEVIKPLTNSGLNVQPIELDLADKKSIQRCIAELAQKSNGQLDILINNAGVISRDLEQPFEELSIEGIEQIFQTNLFGLMRLTQLALPLLRKSPAGRIVNLSSILGSLAFLSENYDSGSLAYNSSKTALNAFTVYLAAKLKTTKIKVNAVHPGWVKTEMGGQAAPMEIVDGAKSSVIYATLHEDGPTGGFFHMHEWVEW